MSDQTDPDEPLMGELRALFARADPVPPLVGDTAKASLGWRRLDAELAELLSDSALDSEAVSLVRSAGAPARLVSFGAGELTIEIEIHRDDGQCRLLGQLSPSASAHVEIQRADGSTVVDVETDRLGRFRARLPPTGLIRLRVMVAGADPAAGVETSWISL